MAKQKAECKNQQPKKDYYKLIKDKNGNESYFYNTNGLLTKINKYKKRLNVIKYLKDNNIQFNLVSDTYNEDFIIEIDIATVSKKDFDDLINNVL